MPLGPKRAPGLYEVPVSNGAPDQDISFGLLFHVPPYLTQESNVVFLLVTG